jgi:hypothetical protein
MTSDEWKEVNAGDVLQNKITYQSFIVVDTQLQDEGMLVVTRTSVAMNPEEWDRRRKVVTVEEQ